MRIRIKVIEGILIAPEMIFEKIGSLSFRLSSQKIKMVIGFVSDCCVVKGGAERKSFLNEITII